MKFVSSEEYIYGFMYLDGLENRFDFSIYFNKNLFFKIFTHI